MKTYSIGRDIHCDIVINDSTDVISRRHALLNIAPSGKMTIVDQSSNGTYVNGIRISPNVAVPVTRKDIISLAHVAKLDWNRVPRSNAWMKYAIAAVVAVAVILGLVFGLKGCQGGKSTDKVVNDSTLIKQQEQARLDSIRDAEAKAAAAKDENKEGDDKMKEGDKDKDKDGKDVKEGDKDKDKDGKEAKEGDKEGDKDQNADKQPQVKKPGKKTPATPAKKPESKPEPKQPKEARPIGS